MPPLSQSFSFSSYGEGLKYNDNDSVRRVTITQLLNTIYTGKDEFKIDEFPLKQFILVANIRRHSKSDFGCVTYDLDDGTGSMKADDWNSRSEEFSDRLSNFKYARVVGRLKAFDKGRTISIQRIVPVSDPAYEIYYHILHVICDSLILERGAPPRHLLQEHAVDTSALSQDFSQQLLVSNSGSINGNDGNDWADSPDSATSQPRDGLQLTELEKDIINCLSEQEGAYDIGGVHVTSFVPAVISLNPGLDLHTFWRALENLTENKILECSNDDQHYRCI